jgi:DNA polymerase-3 subunit alpha
MTMAPFVHLRVHTSYSLSEGAVRMPELLKLAKKYHMPAVGVTDSNNLFGALEYAKAASGAGIQPIHGCVLQCLPEEDPDAPRDQLVLIVQNETGYHHLLSLVSESFLSPVQEPAPAITLRQLEGRTDGLIALTAGRYGAVGRALLNQSTEAAESIIEQLKQLFPDRLYIELQRHGFEDEQQMEPQLVALAHQHKLPLVATNDVFFPDQEMFQAHDALLCIAQGRYLVEENRRKLNAEHYFKSPEAMVELFADLPEAVENTINIARRCAFMSPARAPILPTFVEEGSDRNEAEEFEHVARDGLKWRLENFVYTQEMDAAAREEVATPYWERLDFELNIIQKMQFPGYFLIVSDFIRWSKAHDIPVGPGRGSGAGSLVAWAMKITDLDPLRYGLLFERFLNPERVSMPDFDVDFCQDRRDEVIHYVQQKYGTDRVAQIITFGKLQARAVLRDVGRVLQMPYMQVDKICKLVPNNPANPVTLSEAINMEPLLKQAIRSDEQVEILVNMALKLEGLFRHSSTHAAGVVIGDRPLDQLVPLYRDPKSDMPVVQFSMKYAEMAGLVKFDFLGLKTLTVLSRACQMIQETMGDEIDLLKIPEGDKLTYRMLGEGDAIGVFQLESAGMRDTLKKLKPDTMEDIIALVSLYRPGPMDNIPTYIARKHGKEEPDYPHPMIREILEETFGVIIYQEQVMQIAQVMGGYSLGQADLLRRAMGKKIKEEMDKQRDIFVEGAQKKDVSKAKANEVFDLMAKFASYGFNKSHAAAYALIAYQTAYLKANYPVQFYAALMSLDAGNTDKLQLFRQDAMQRGIEILPPDVNASGADFTVEKLESGDYAVRYALGALKNVGMGAMEALEKERQDHGPYQSVYDFAERLGGQVMNKRQLEYLVKSGAMDSLHDNRRSLFEAIDRLSAYSIRVHEERESNQASLFGDAGQGADAEQMHPKLSDGPDWPSGERLNYEATAVGFYLSSHPLEAYSDLLKSLRVVQSDQFESSLSGEYSPLKVAGIVQNRKVKISDRGKFAFLGLSDAAGAYEASIFDERLLNQQWDRFEEGSLLVIGAEGKLDDRGVRLIVQSIQTLDEAATRKEQQIFLTLEESINIDQLKPLLAEGKGTALGNLRIKVPIPKDEQAVIRLKGQYRLGPTLIEQLERLPGVVNVTMEGH